MGRLIVEHLIPSGCIGVGAWILSGEWFLFVIALCTGWLIDVDHLLDLVLSLFRNGKISSLGEMIKNGSYFERNGKIIVFLHSWELALLWTITWCFLGWPAIGFAGGLSWLIHLFVDQKSYNLSPWAYFLTYRLVKGFNIRWICKKAA